MTHFTSIKTIIPLGIIVLGLLTYNFMSAQWSQSSGAAPGNNQAAPINVSSSYQAKLGDLGAIRMRADEYCDAAGLNCYPIASLAGGGGDGITQLTGGPGIVLSPTTITSTGTISVDANYLQQRVAGWCLWGQGLKYINPDGTFMCSPTTARCFYKELAYTQGGGCLVDTGSCGTGTQYTYLSCQYNGTWLTESVCTAGTNPAYKYRPCP